MLAYIEAEIEDSDIAAAHKLPDSKKVKNRMIVILNFYREKIERKITKGEGTWLEKDTSHLPSQSIDETRAVNSKIFINECVVYR